MLVALPSASTTASSDPAIAALFETHAPKLLRAAARITGSPAEAEDVVQTVFLRLLRRQDETTIDPDGAGAYLRRAAVNAALDVVRTRRRRATEGGLDDGETVAHEAGPARQLAGRELARGLRRALAEVSPRQAEVFAMRYFSDLSNREIAHALGTSAGVVAVTLHRVRAQLRDRLDAHLGDLS